MNEADRRLSMYLILLSGCIEYLEEAAAHSTIKAQRARRLAAAIREEFDLINNATPAFINENLLTAAEIVLDGLNARLAECRERKKEQPVFAGIAELHDAINEARGITDD